MLYKILETEKNIKNIFAIFFYKKFIIEIGVPVNANFKFRI